MLPGERSGLRGLGAEGFIWDRLHIIKKLSLKSYESEYKIQIIWLPEKMAAPASNKLLKIIEEPPLKTIFILVSEAPEQLLPTILSRTQIIKIKSVDDNTLMNYISDVKNLELKQSRRIAHLCDGDIGKALEMASNYSHDTANDTAFILWMRMLLKPLDNYIDISRWVDEIAGSGRENQKTFLRFSIETVRECLMVNHGDETLVRFDNEVIENFDKFSVFIHSGNAHDLMEILNHSYHAIERNANPKILFLDLSFKISRLLRVKKPHTVVQYN